MPRHNTGVCGQAFDLSAAARDDGSGQEADFNRLKNLNRLNY
jgi:hypothetical protein